MVGGNKYLLAGGIAQVVMHPSNSNLPDELLALTDQSITLELHHEGSEYTETRSSKDGLYAVTHRLKMAAYIGDGVSTDEMIRNGVVADILLNSGAKIRVGWSEKFGAKAPLRLVSCDLVSGDKRLDYPLKMWVWESTDLTSLI